VPSNKFGFSIIAKPTDENLLSHFWIIRDLGKFSSNLIQKYHDNNIGDIRYVLVYSKYERYKRDSPASI